MPVDLWKFESRLYADIDACGARGKPILKKEYSLGSCQKVNIYIRLKTGNAISNQLAVLPREIKFIVNFRRNSTSWFRVGNDHNYLHIDFEIDDKLRMKHYRLERKYSVGKLLDFSFRKCKKLMSKYFPSTIITDSKEGFQGFA